MGTDGHQESPNGPSEAAVPPFQLTRDRLEIASPPPTEPHQFAYTADDSPANASVQPGQLAYTADDSPANASVQPGQLAADADHPPTKPRLRRWCPIDRSAVTPPIRSRRWIHGDRSRNGAQPDSAPRSRPTRAALRPRSAAAAQAEIRPGARMAPSRCLGRQSARPRSRAEAWSNAGKPAAVLLVGTMVSMPGMVETVSAQTKASSAPRRRTG